MIDENQNVSRTVPSLARSIATGAIGFGLVSLCVFATVAFGERWMYQTLGLFGAYLTLTRSTVWISILAYAIGCVVFATARLDRWARLAWTVGCATLVAHFICAFDFYHAWSHKSAYIETARQTAEVFGINWGGGLFINYAVAALWISDVAWWWGAGVSSYRCRPWLLTLIWHGFLIFIIFNATVVFKDGLTRWIGLLVSLTLCLSWVFISRQRPLSTKTEPSAGSAGSMEMIRRDYWTGTERGSAGSRE